MSSSIFPDPSKKNIHFKPLTISSAAFQNKELIPVRYTCEGTNISPSLDIENIPTEAKCLAVIMDDPDAPKGTWVHWVAWNIPVTPHLKENEVHGIEGLNDFQQHRYGGPCPPSGTHRYFFKIYALDKLLVLPSDTKKEELEMTMANHIIAFGELIGLYKRTR